MRAKLGTMRAVCPTTGTKGFCWWIPALADTVSRIGVNVGKQVKLLASAMFPTAVCAASRVDRFSTQLVSVRVKVVVTRRRIMRQTSAVSTGLRVSVVPRQVRCGREAFGVFSD